MAAHNEFVCLLRQIVRGTLEVNAYLYLVSRYLARGDIFTQKECFPVSYPKRVLFLNNFSGRCYFVLVLGG